LAGPHRVDLWDNDKTRTRDLGSNFYLDESHVGNKSRATGCHEKLKELNNYVKVDVVTADLGMELFNNYDVVVFTEVFTSLDDIKAWNKELRA
jgi:ubiquitin-activating enzyme E1